MDPTRLSYHAMPRLCESYSSYGTPWRGFASVGVYEAEGQLDR